MVYLLPAHQLKAKAKFLFDCAERHSNFKLF
jgi:hypothetical protein